MRRQDEAQLHTPPIPEDEAFTLESILAEYGKGGRQPAQTEEVPPPQPAPEPIPEPEPEPVPPPEPAPQPEPEEEITTRLPGCTSVWMAMFRPWVALPVKITLDSSATPNSFAAAARQA